MKTIAGYAMFTGDRGESADYEFVPKCRSNPKSFLDWVGLGVVDGMLMMVTANTTITASLYGDSGGKTARAGYVTRLYRGDQRAPLFGTETQTHVPASDPNYGVFAWSESTWAADGTLNNGIAEANFNDVITGSADNDDIQGKGGSDALSGAAGNDTITGLEGDNILEGGEGDDRIEADGIVVPDYFSSVALDKQGQDFVDGGAGNDKIVGGGKADVLEGDATTHPPRCTKRVTRRRCVATTSIAHYSAFTWARWRFESITAPKHPTRPQAYPERAQH